MTLINWLRRLNKPSFIEGSMVRLALLPQLHLIKALTKPWQGEVLCYASLWRNYHGCIPGYTCDICISDGLSGTALSHTSCWFSWKESKGGFFSLTIFTVFKNGNKAPGKWSNILLYFLDYMIFFPIAGAVTYTEKDVLHKCCINNKILKSALLIC